jgi:hypothetical protein
MSEADLVETRATLFGNDDDENESFLSKNSRLKMASPPPANSSKVVDFILTEETPFLTLIEGISNLCPDIRPKHETTTTLKTIDDSRRKIAQPWEWPCPGRLLKLPMFCQLGKWKAEIVAELENDSRPKLIGTDNENGDVATLHGYRICLRHESWYTMGKLLSETIEQQAIYDLATGRSSGHPNLTKEEHSIRVTSIYPSENRLFDVRGQHQNTQLNDRSNNTFIGSITMVGCDATLNPSTATSTRSLSMAKDILQYLKIQPSSNGARSTNHDDSDYPKLFKVSQGGRDDSCVVGFSVLCRLPLEANYHLRFAQDFSLEKNDIAAIDSECLWSLL